MPEGREPCRPFHLAPAHGPGLGRTSGKPPATLILVTLRIEDGVGIFRAGIWGQQYTDVLKLSPGDLSTVIVIRHAAIPLAMSSEFWATYGLGKELKIKGGVLMHAHYGGVDHLDGRIMSGGTASLNGNGLNNQLYPGNGNNLISGVLLAEA